MTWNSRCAEGISVVSVTEEYKYNTSCDSTEITISDLDEFVLNWKLSLITVTIDVAFVQLHGMTS